MKPFLEIGSLLILVVLVFLAWRMDRRWCRAIRRGFSRIARRRWLSILGVAVLAVGSSAAISLLDRWPQPRIHDEFSYLLGADTIAHGRLANPPHPLWVHFETFHVIHQPTYASKYPPGQAAVLAVGQVLGGHPLVGVWLSMGLCCGAICWMLQGWLPPRWALLGALLATARLVFFGRPYDGEVMGYWSQSYFGGGVAAVGGALLFGSLRQILRRPSTAQAVILCLGMAILANTRPFEGLVVLVPVFLCLGSWLVREKRVPRQVKLRTVVAPIACCSVMILASILFCNWQVTRHPSRFPYQIHHETYSQTPLFLTQGGLPEKEHRHPIMRSFHTGWEYDVYVQQTSWSGLADATLLKLRRLWSVYLDVVFTLPLVAVPWALGNRWMRFALLTWALLLVALLQITWVYAHYAAPGACLVFFVVIQCLRHLRLGKLGSVSVGSLLFRAILVLTFADIPLSFGPAGRVNVPGWEQDRARIIAQLRQEEGQHLVIVRYRLDHRTHDEWVCNEADIDAARIVWAREMNAAQDRELLAYFRDRRIWLLEADEQPPRLKPYPTE